VDLLMLCPRCSRMIQEHMARVDRMFGPVVKP